MPFFAEKKKKKEVLVYRIRWEAQAVKLVLRSLIKF